jgi:coenzyme PQQ precursor peptide PqqA
MEPTTIAADWINPSFEEIPVSMECTAYSGDSGADFVS